MSVADPLRAVIVLVLGLLLGSILPADLLARRRGIDIRANGDGNPGTVNAFRVLGRGAGIVTAVYDIAIGVVVLQIALRLGLSEGTAYAAGFATVVGHRFPLMRGFRGGGEGMAASAGLLVYGIGVALSRGWISFVDLGGLVVILLAAYAFTRYDSAAAVVVLPALVVRLVIAPTDWQYLAFMSVTAGYIWAVQVIRVRRWLATRNQEAARGHSRG